MLRRTKVMERYAFGARERGPNSQTSESVGECGDGVKLARKKPKSPFGKSEMSVSADEDAAHGDVDHGG